MYLLHLLDGLQMGDAYKITLMDLVENIRQFLLKDAT